MVRRGPKGGHGRAKHEIAVARGQDNVALGPGQFSPKGGAAAPTAAAAAAFEVGAGLSPATVGLNQGSAAQGVVQQDGIRLQDLPELVRHPTGVDGAALAGLKRRFLGGGYLLAFSFLQPCPPVGDAGDVAGG